MESFIFFTSLLIINISLFIYFFYSLYIIKKNIIHFRKEIIKNHNDMNILMDGNFGINQKTKDLEINYANLVKNASKNQISSKHSIQNEQKFYKQAKQLKKIGADSDEIKYSCNLSQMEMELIEALGEHKPVES